MNRQALSQSSNPLLHNLRDLTQIQSSKTSPLACSGSQTLGFCARTSIYSDWSAQLQVAQGFEYHPWLHGHDIVLVHLFKGITHLSPLKTHIREITPCSKPTDCFQCIMASKPSLSHITSLELLWLLVFPDTQSILPPKNLPLRLTVPLPGLLLLWEHRATSSVILVLAKGLSQRARPQPFGQKRSSFLFQVPLYVLCFTS